MKYLKVLDVIVLAFAVVFTCKLFGASEEAGLFGAIIACSMWAANNKRNE